MHSQTLLFSFFILSSVSYLMTLLISCLIWEAESDYLYLHPMRLCNSMTICLLSRIHKPYICFFPYRYDIWGEGL